VSRARAAASLLCGICAAACAGEDDLPSLEVTSLAFGDGETIPARHTCEGAGISPPLRFEGAPAQTTSYAVVMFRAAEGGDVEGDEEEAAIAQWLVWGISAEASGVGEDVPHGEAPLAGLAQGTNDAGVVGYTGPCAEETEKEEAPDTATHRYVFQVYALSGAPVVDPAATAGQLLTAIDGLAVAKGSLEGFFTAQ